MYKLNDIINEFTLRKLNSLTKYPSISTYHNLGDKGCLKESHVENKSFTLKDLVYLTEKIDGTNSRIVIFNGDYLIGGREEFVYAKGDRIADPTLNIAKTLIPLADQLVESMDFSYGNFIRIIFLETYGGNITKASRQYTFTKDCAFRMFDAISIPESKWREILSLDLPDISSWRNHGGQPYVTVNMLHNIGYKYSIPTVPYIETVSGLSIPVTLADTFDWLQTFAKSRATIDENYREAMNSYPCKTSNRDNEYGHSEGVVIRTSDRSLIRKIRFEDYERTKKNNIF